MKTYINIAKFSFLKFLTYPWELFAWIFSNLISFGFLIFFWSLVLKDNQDIMSTKEIISYFLIAMGIFDINFINLRFAWFTSLNIKSGGISTYLMKPLKIIPHMYASLMGGIFIRLSVMLLAILAGLIINPPKTFGAFLFFVLFFGLSHFISLGINLAVASLSFIFTETNGIQNTTVHIIRFLSGAMIPLSLFPEKIKSLVDLSPFANMVFGPINILKSGNILSLETFRMTVISLLWAIISLSFGYLVWKKCLKKHEAIGI